MATLILNEIINLDPSGPENPASAHRFPDYRSWAGDGMPPVRANILIRSSERLRWLALRPTAFWAHWKLDCPITANAANDACTGSICGGMAGRPRGIRTSGQPLRGRFGVPPLPVVSSTGILRARHRRRVSENHDNGAHFSLRCPRYRHSCRPAGKFPAELTVCLHTGGTTGSASMPRRLQAGEVSGHETYPGAAVWAGGS